MIERDEVGEEFQWLRETVEPELEGLFEDDRGAVSATVSRLVERLPFDRALEDSCIDALQQAVDLSNDDTEGAVWIALVLGETATIRAVPTFIQALADDGDEELQVAAGIAILKCGEPGVDALMEMLEDESPAPVLQRVSFELLGCVGYLRDELLREKVMTFLTNLLEDEVLSARSLALVEGIARAAAWLGHVELLPALKRAREEHFADQSFGFDDYLEMLEENSAAVPVAGELLPGEEEYAWAFDFEGETFRPRRKDAGPVETVAFVEGSAEVLGDEEDGTKASPDSGEREGESGEDLERYLEGLGGEPGLN